MTFGRIIETVIVPIYKKGDNLDCNNFRGISVLNTTYKILSKILEKRLQEYKEKILGEHQPEFRRQKSTTDQLFIIRQAVSKYWELNQNGFTFYLLVSYGNPRETD